MKEGYVTETAELKEGMETCLYVGRRLLQNGAESYLIRNLIERIGKVLGLDSTEVSLSSASMAISVSKGDDWYTRVVKCPDRGVNMAIVMNLQKLIVSREKGLIDNKEMLEALHNISDKRYNRWLTACIVALSCGCFSRLGGGEWIVFLMVSIASFIGFTALVELKHRNFSHLMACFGSAFITTLVTGAAVKAELVPEESAGILMLAAILMLVPGIPLVNGVSDLLKGFKNMGLARWTFASLLTLSIAIGMILSMKVMGV